MKLTNETFQFTSAPGHLLIDELEARDLEFTDFQNVIGANAPSRGDVLSGAWEITPAMAEKLEAFLEIPARMWLGLEEDFRKAAADGKVIVNAERPEKQRGLNGKILLRVPMSLHKRVAETAKTEGISLNQLLLSYVAEGLGRSERAS